MRSTRQKFILVGGTLAVTLTAALLYSWLAGTEVPQITEVPVTIEPLVVQADPCNHVTMIDTGQVMAGDIKAPVFTERDADGRIVWEFGFARRVPGSADSFDVQEPWLRIYDDSGRIVELMGANGSVEVTERPGDRPRYGTLTAVRLAMFEPGRAAASHAMPDPNHWDAATLTARLGALEFQQEFSRIIGTGSVSIDGQDFQLRGRDLTATYDVIQDRLTDLEIPVIHSLIVNAEAMEQAKAERDKDEADTPTDETKAKKTAKAPNRFRLRLVDQVVIDRGTEQLFADSITFLAALGSTDQPDRPAKPDRAAMPTTDTGRVTAVEPAAGPDTWSDTITLHCAGPLIVNQLADDHDTATDAGSLLFIAEGTPVRLLRDAQPAVQADAIRFDHDAGTITLEPGVDRPVRLAMSDGQWLDSKGSILIDQAQGRAVLDGAGTIAYSPDGTTLTSGASDTVEQTQIQYDQALNVLFDRPEDLASTDMMGGDSARLFETIRALEFVGHVRAHRQDSSLRCDRLLASLANDPEGHLTLTECLATGHVVMDNDQYSITASERLSVAFDDTDTKTSDRDTGDPLDDFAKLQIRHAVATGANDGVRITDKRNEYVIIGSRAEGPHNDNTWSITGNPARIESTDPANELRQLSGESIQADLDAGLFGIPGAGKILLETDQSLDGRRLDQPTQLAVSWQQYMTYSRKKNTVQLVDVTAAMAQTDGDLHRSGALQCATMTLLLEDDEQPRSDLATSRLKTLVAEGPNVHMTQCDTLVGSNDPIRQSDLYARQLTYDNRTGVLRGQGAGFLEIRQYASDHKTQDSAMALSRSMGSVFDDADSYTLLTFGGDMTFTQTDGIAFGGGVSLSYLPVDTRTLQLPTAAGAGLPAELKGKLVRLDSNELLLHLDASNTPSRLEARGGAFLELPEGASSHTLIGQSLHYDITREVFWAQADGGMPVILDQMPFQTVRYERPSRRIFAVPTGSGAMIPGP